MSTITQLENNVIEWSIARNMFDKDNGATFVTQLFKFAEEQGEKYGAKLKGKRTEMKDGNGDMHVVHVNMAALFNKFGLQQVDRLTLSEKLYLMQLSNVGRLADAILREDTSAVEESLHNLKENMFDITELDGFTIDECLLHAYNEIKDRTGEMRNRTFVKAQDL